MTSAQRLRLAEALLAKARATGFDPERAAFVAGAHDQLAAYLGGSGAPTPPEAGSAWRIASTYRPVTGPGVLVDLAL